MFSAHTLTIDFHKRWEAMFEFRILELHRIPLHDVPAQGELTQTKAQPLPTPNNSI